MVESPLNERLRRAEYILRLSSPAIGVLAGLWLTAGLKSAFIGGAVAELCVYVWWRRHRSEERLILRVAAILDEGRSGLDATEATWLATTAGVARSQDVADAARDAYRQTGTAILQNLCDGLAELDPPDSIAEQFEAVIETIGCYRLEYSRLCADPELDRSDTSLKSARARIGELVEQTDDAVAMLWASAAARAS